MCSTAGTYNEFASIRKNSINVLCERELQAPTAAAFAHVVKPDLQSTANMHTLLADCFSSDK